MSSSAQEERHIAAARALEHALFAWANEKAPPIDVVKAIAELVVAITSPLSQPNNSLKDQ